MTIISFFISERFKNAVQRILEIKNKFVSKSKFFRDAIDSYLIKLNGIHEIEDLKSFDIDGKIILTIKDNFDTIKKIFIKEEKVKDNIILFQSNKLDNCELLFYEFKGNVFDFNSFIDDLGSLDEILNIRYIITDTIP